jgi:hypothetical protein
MSASKFTIESSKAKRIESYDTFIKEEKDKVFLITSLWEND